MDVGLVKGAYAKSMLVLCGDSSYLHTYISLVFDMFLLRTDIKMTCVTMRLSQVVSVGN
jgi:hypothetical protein